MADQLTIYTGPKCHLCEQAKGLLYPLVAEKGWRLVEVDITSDSALQAQYGIRIPVVVTPNGKEKGWPFTAAQIARMLD
ncbi:MAG: glutaredoxin family protein [Porticoccaceae bacterium]